MTKEKDILTDFDAGKTLHEIQRDNDVPLDGVMKVLKKHGRRRIRPSQVIQKEFLDSLRTRAEVYWKKVERPPPKDDEFTRLVIPLIGTELCFGLIMAHRTLQKYPGLRKYWHQYYGEI